MLKHKFIVFAFCLLLTGCFFIFGCKKAPNTGTTQYLTDTLAGQYLVSGNYSHLFCTSDSSYTIPPSILYVIKLDSARLKIVLPSHFTIDSCILYNTGYWSGTMEGNEIGWLNNTNFTINRDSITMSISTQFNTGFASQPCEGGHYVSGKKIQ